MFYTCTTLELHVGVEVDELLVALPEETRHWCLDVVWLLGARLFSLEVHVLGPIDQRLRCSQSCR